MFDVIVVGAGGTMGSSALHHLAKSGVKVLGLEAQAEAPHSNGSHHGHTRVIRTAYVEHPSYLPLLGRAHQLWQELQQASGQVLLETTGCIYSSEGTLENSCTQHAIHVAGEHALEHRILAKAEAAKLFPGYRAFPEDAKFMYEPAAAVLQPEGCIRASLTLALSAGAELVCGAAVTGWRVDDQGTVHVHTSKGEYEGRKLILAPGAWLPKLVPELQSLLSVERQVVGWFEVLNGSADFDADRFPMFVMDDRDGADATMGFPKTPAVSSLVRSTIWERLSTLTGWHVTPLASTRPPYAGRCTSTSPARRAP
uniref:FAD dependent oxidoreductase domain-containing protein n=1 Tax=Auxenochlorella protothecoides TaxID=3075 RepID=A0A1D2AAP4_AUXPR